MVCLFFLVRGGAEINTSQNLSALVVDTLNIALPGNSGLCQESLLNERGELISTQQFSALFSGKGQKFDFSGLFQAER